MSDIADRVRRIVSEQLGRPEDEILEEKSFVEDLGADSMDLTNLVMGIEEEFSLAIPDDAAGSIETVGDAIKFVTKTVG